MNRQCTQCNTNLEDAWSFCPRCGAHGAVPVATPREHQPVPHKGAYSGLVYGIVAAPILIAFGIMICLTGWGLFLGIPVIALGVLAPLAGPIFGLGEHQGKCPKCGMRVVSGPDQRAHACPHCGEQVAVVDEHGAHPA